MMTNAGSWKRAAVVCLGAGMLMPVAPLAMAAESGVTVYGVISSALRTTSNIDGKGGNKTEVVASGIGGSRLGISGTEDLGGGNKAIFQLESGFGTDTGQPEYGILFGRQAFVGLSGSWGSLTFGRQYNAVNNVGWSFNPLDQSWGNYWSDPYYTGGDIFMQGYRINNSVIYKRTIGPVSLQLDYGAGEQTGGGTRGSTFGGGIMYSKDGLGLGAACDERRASSEGGNTVSNYTLGASWAAGKATTYIGRMGRHESAGDARFLISFIGLGYQLTPALHLSGAFYRYVQGGGVTTQFQAAPILLGRGRTNVFAAVADYALSKRTSLFLEADVNDAHDGAVGRETEYWGSGPVLGIGHAARKGVMVGLRHQF